MPTYDYRCGDCGHEFELFQSMKDRPKRTCPSCKKKALERLIGTGAAVLFKGSGFYETDYRSESYKKAAEADKKASSGKDTTDSSSKSSDKAESTPKTETGKSGKSAKSTKPDKPAGSSSKSKS